MTHAHTVWTHTHTHFTSSWRVCSLCSLSISPVCSSLFFSIVSCSHTNTHKHNYYHCIRTVNKSVARKILIKENTTLTSSGQADYDGFLESTGKNGNAVMILMQNVNTHTHSTSASLSLRSNHPLVPSMDSNWACRSSTLCCRPSSSLLRAYNTQQCFKHTHTPFYIPLFYIISTPLSLIHSLFLHHLPPQSYFYGISFSVCN